MNATDRRTAIESIVARATRSAANATRRGTENLGCIAQFSKGAQRGMGIEYPTAATAFERDIIRYDLVARGFTVRTNSEWSPRHRRETFISFTVTAPTA